MNEKYTSKCKCKCKCEFWKKKYIKKAKKKIGHVMKVLKRKGTYSKLTFISKRVLHIMTRLLYYKGYKVFCFTEYRFFSLYGISINF